MGMKGVKMFGGIQRIILPMFGRLIGMLITIKSMVGEHFFKLGAVVLLIGYIIGAQYLTGLYQANNTAHTYSSLINTIFILIGAVLTIGVWSLFIKQNKDEHVFPTGFVDRLSWMFKVSLPVYKNILMIGVTLALMLFILYIISHFSSLSMGISIILQIAVIVAIISVAFLFIRGNPEWMKKIKHIPMLTFLYHFIFVIPCGILYVTNYLFNQIKETPWVVWIVLLVEIIGIALYFLLPILFRYLYIHTSKKDTALIVQAAGDGNQTSLLSVENEMVNIMDHIDIDWTMVMRDHLYSKNNQESLENYLKKQGYTSADQPYQKQSFWARLFKKSLSLEAAVSYVQTNGPLLVSLENDVLQLKNQTKQQSENKQSSLFKNKILLDKPVYTDSMQDIGSYENLGGDIDIYNYNYALSAWFFIHEQPPSARSTNNRFTSLLNYGDKPNILYKVRSHTLQIKMNSGIDKEIVLFETTTFPLQTWNNIVINYNGGTLDVFINNTLVSSTNNIVPYMSYDKVTVGEDNGVSGGCCNVTYFSSPLTLRKIALNYDALKHKNPPII
ncbi:MAG: hypothetical protein CL685_00740 [Candidatus Magasanikbacteria bacterium]|nr:hypothetical protein [Candidatus Magasanikbacteria bacterium]